ncbi:MAG: diacylglycerol kinase [Candidatus Zixiibacteriota bacterium]
MTKNRKKRNRVEAFFMKEGGLARSFNSALEGIVYALRTQRNVKIHFAVTVLALVASVWLSITKTELILLLITIALVLITEMINSSLEVMLDLTVERYHPMARIAKDVAAGAVLFSSLNAVLVGYLIFFERLKGPIVTTLVNVRRTPEHVAVVSLGLTVLLVFIVKAVTGKGTFLRGGLPSGHAAAAFGLWTAVSLLSRNPLIAVITFVLALTIAVSRIRMGIHSFLEVAAGALLGVSVTAFCFWIFT